MGQETDKRTKGKARKMLTPEVNKTFAQSCKIYKKCRGSYQKKNLAEIGEVFTLNNLNSPHGAECQEPLMDHKLYCYCHNWILLTF